MDFSALLSQLPLSPQAALQNDSRKVRAGDVFIACQGEYADGRDYIADAIARGAAAVVYDSDNFSWQEQSGVPFYPVPQLRQYVGVLVSQAYENPSWAVPVIGVTGTNGKTSCTHWLAQAFDFLQQKTAVVGTVGNGFMGDLQVATHTTPDPLTLQTLLHALRQQGAKRIAMEVSSHGLEQHRVEGVRFDIAILTNLTRDHLDYHGSMSAYAAAKAKLFQMPHLRVAILNRDDAFGIQLLEQLDASVTGYTYGFHEQAQVKCTRLDLSAKGMRLFVSSPWGEGLLESALIGRFNAYNLLAVLTALLASGVMWDAALQALQIVKPALGRMQTVGVGQPLVVVDYAHTPDALEKALQTLKEMLPDAGRLWCVFGCGGDRDKGKRPIMGEIAYRCADHVILTSDNPRTEDPLAILSDVSRGAPLAMVISDRAEAIQLAVSQAALRDVVLVAGKGHETYQEIKGVRYPFDDVKTVLQAVACRQQGG